MPYDKAKAARVETFFRQLKHTKGRWHGQPFELMPWQRGIVRKVFGTVDRNGKRIIKTVFIFIPKKDGKTPFAAGIADYMLTSDGEYGAEVYCAAGDRFQASLAFDHAHKMAIGNTALRKRLAPQPSVKRLVYPATNSFMQALSAEDATKHGINPSCIIFDELHAQPNRKLHDTLTMGTMEAREQPLLIYITTAGVFDVNHICYEVYNYAKKVRDGIIDDPSFLPVIYEVEQEDDWEDEKNWKKANPSLGITITIEGMRAEYKKAKEVPALESMFRRMRLNQWVRSEVRYLPMDRWTACGMDYSVEDLLGRTCYGGLDLANVLDIAALALVFPPDNPREREYGVEEKDDAEDNGQMQVEEEMEIEPWRALLYFWLPKDTAIRREHTDRVPYPLWAEQGHIELTEGNVTDYNAIKKTLNDVSLLFDVREIGFDRWGSTKIVNDLTDEGFTMVQFGQGFASMSPPTKELLKMVLTGEFAHNNNPVLNWMADNMMVRQDPAGNVKPDKDKSREKIDGMVALIMGLDRALRNLGGSVYERRGILAL